MATSRAELLARLREIERHLVDMPPHNASGSRDDLERQRTDLQRRLAATDRPAPAAPKAAPTAVATAATTVPPAATTPDDLPDPRQGAPRDPRDHSPALAPGWFRRTTHVAAGPAPGLDYGDGVEVARDLHGGCRDVRRHDDGTLHVLDEASISGHLDEHRTITRLELARGEVPAELVGVAALPGLRGIVSAAIDDTTSATAAVLLDLGIGGNLAAYGRMQAGRQAGQSSTQQFRRSAIDRLGDSCRGWAVDGAMVANLLAEVHRPSVRPPAVADPDLDGWHDLGPLPPWWVRRRRRLDVLHHPDGTIDVDASFRDSWVDAEGEERSLHEWELVLVVDADGIVQEATARARSLPFADCPGVADAVPDLRGAPVLELRQQARAVMGGPVGCTHLNDLLSTIPSAVTVAGRTPQESP